MSDLKFRLGDTLRDTITKFEGVCVSNGQWLNGNRYCLQSRKLKDDKPLEAVWFDEEQLELVKAVKPAHRPTHGGPDRHEPRRSF